MCVCLFVCHLCPSPLFLFKVNISWVSSVWMFLTSQSRDLLSARSAPPCLTSQSVCSAFISNQISVCTYTCVCLYIYRVSIGVLYACACALFPLLSFICFPFQPLHEVTNAWVWFFFLPPPPLPLSHASSLFLLCGLLGFLVLFFCCYILVYFYFASLPFPSLLFLWHSELG